MKCLPSFMKRAKNKNTILCVLIIIFIHARKGDQNHSNIIVPKHMIRDCGQLRRQPSIANEMEEINQSLAFIEVKQNMASNRKVQKILTSKMDCTFLSDKGTTMPNPPPGPVETRSRASNKCMQECPNAASRTRHICARSESPTTIAKARACRRCSQPDANPNDRYPVEGNSQGAVTDESQVVLGRPSSVDSFCESAAGSKFKSYQLSREPQLEALLTHCCISDSAVRTTSNSSASTTRASSILENVADDSGPHHRENGKRNPVGPDADSGINFMLHEIAQIEMRARSGARPATSSPPQPGAEPRRMGASLSENFSSRSHADGASSRTTSPTLSRVGRKGVEGLGCRNGQLALDKSRRSASAERLPEHYGQRPRLGPTSPDLSSAKGLRALLARRRENLYGNAMAQTGAGATDAFDDDDVRVLAWTAQGVRPLRCGAEEGADPVGIGPARRDSDLEVRDMLDQIAKVEAFAGGGASDRECFARGPARNVRRVLSPPPQSTQSPELAKGPESSDDPADNAAVCGAVRLPTFTAAALAGGVGGGSCQEACGAMSSRRQWRPHGIFSSWTQGRSFSTKLSWMTSWKEVLPKGGRKERDRGDGGCLGAVACAVRRRVLGWHAAGSG